MGVRSTAKKNAPWWAHYAYRKLYYLPRDFPAAFSFIFHRTKSGASRRARFAFVRACYKISYHVDCPHTEHEIIAIARAILDLGADVSGVIVEAGAFHGGSTAKLSLAAALCGRRLAVFDSFEGMPENNETHGKSIYRREHHFPKGSHAVPLEEVKGNVERYGAAGACEFHKGFFEKTMPDFKTPVAAACINVDLTQSTKTCLKYLYPLVSRGGIIFSQDAHFPWIIALLSDENFWRDELGVAKPAMDDLGHAKLVAIHPAIYPTIGPAAHP